MVYEILSYHWGRGQVTVYRHFPSFKSYDEALEALKQMKRNKHIDYKIKEIDNGN